jgi:hypothetical protein
MPSASELPYDRSEGTFTTAAAETTGDNHTFTRHTFSVNRDKLESILASQKSMQNYEDALWGFEKTLNQEIDSNRL